MTYDFARKLLFVMANPFGYRPIANLLVKELRVDEDLFKRSKDDGVSLLTYSV